MRKAVEKSRVPSLYHSTRKLHALRDARSFGNIGLGRTLPSTLEQLCQCRHGVSAMIQFIVDRLRSRYDYAASTRASLSARASSVAGRAR
jgi:hypothetical protein